MKISNKKKIVIAVVCFVVLLAVVYYFTHRGFPKDELSDYPYYSECELVKIGDKNEWVDIDSGSWLIRDYKPSLMVGKSGSHVTTFVFDSSEKAKEFFDHEKSIEYRILEEGSNWYTCEANFPDYGMAKCIWYLADNVILYLDDSQYNYDLKDYIFKNAADIRREVLSEVLPALDEKLKQETVDN